VSLRLGEQIEDLLVAAYAKTPAVDPKNQRSGSSHVAPTPSNEQQWHRPPMQRLHCTGHTLTRL